MSEAAKKPAKKRTWSKETRAKFNQRKLEAERERERAYREEWKNAFPFMFVRVKDEADAIDFLMGVILPDFYGWDQKVTPDELWQIVKQYSRDQRRLQRTQRIIAGACEQWNQNVRAAA